MTGTVLAAASGVGFGLFQSVNARAVRAAEDPFASTFVQVAVAAVALAAAALGSGELGGALHAPAWAIADFAIAGTLHFLTGWTLLNLSQQRIGAARTSPLLTTVPVFGVIIAAVTLGQLPGAGTLVAIAVMVSGAYVVAARGGVRNTSPRDALPGLGCALMWAVSPIFTLRGLKGFESPLAGLTIGLLVSVAGAAAAYALWRGRAAWGALGASLTPLKVLAGVLVAVATWWRWAALEDATVGAVLALSLLSVPIVLTVAPLVAGRHAERITSGLVAGAALVVAGALILVAT